jgi:hypothetical protein
MNPAQRQYWIRIGVGAFVIFGVGMGAVYGWTGMKSIAAAHAIPLAMLPIRVDGQEIGRLHQVDVEKLSSGDVASVQVKVRSSDSTLAEKYSRCLLVPSRSHSRRKFTDFSCVTPADSAGRDLRRIGEIVVEPDDVTLTLMVPASRLADWEDADWSNDSSVKTVHIQADSNGAVIDVRGPGGQRLFHLEADSGGARISVTHDSGRAAKHK